MHDDFLKLGGKRAIVVGGGFGMGRGTAMKLAQAGCKLAVLDLDGARAENVAREIQEAGGEAQAFVCNALDVANLQGAIAKACDRLGGADILATIVGQAGWNDVFHMTPEEWDRDHNRNLRYVFFAIQAFAQAAARDVKPRAVVTIASVSGVQSSPYSASYGAAKAGLCNMVKSLAVELAKHQIRVNAIAPGVIETPRTAASRNYAEFRERVARSPIPFKRPGEVDDIAKAALFLASDLASYVTGQTLCVDGGWTAANLAAEALGLAQNVPNHAAT